MLEQIASTKFTRRKPDGTIVEWQQEDEAAVISKAQAVAMVQRTIDFWLPKLADDLHTQKAIPLPMPEAKLAAVRAFQGGFRGLLASSFARKWGLTMADFTLEISD